MATRLPRAREGFGETLDEETRSPQATLPRLLRVQEGLLLDELGVALPGVLLLLGRLPEGEVARGRARGDGRVEAHLEAERLRVLLRRLDHPLHEVPLHPAVEGLVVVLVRAPEDVEA